MSEGSGGCQGCQGVMSGVPGGCEGCQDPVWCCCLIPCPAPLLSQSSVQKRGCRSGKEAPKTMVCHKGPCREGMRGKARQASSSSASDSSPHSGASVSPLFKAAPLRESFPPSCWCWGTVPGAIPGEEMEGTTPPPCVSCPIAELQPHLVGNKHPMERHAWPAKVSSQHLISHGQALPD